MGTQSATRALVSATVTPDRQFQLTAPSLLTGQTGYRPTINLGISPLRLGGLPPPGLSPGLSGGRPPIGGQTPGQPGAPATATPGNWQVVAQAVMQTNFANFSLSPGVAPPLAGTAFQFNLLFGTFDNKLQAGEYFSGSGSFSNDAAGRVYSISYGVLLGGNDLMVRGPLSFINPQLQAGPNFTNLGRSDASAQIAGNVSNFVNFNARGSALTVGVGGQLGYAYDFSTGVSAFSASLLLQFQLQKLLGSP